MYSEAATLHVTKTITTTLACVLLVASIVLFYVIGNMTKLLGVIAALTAMISFFLVLVTSAGVANIFTATAA